MNDGRRCPLCPSRLSERGPRFLSLSSYSLGDPTIVPRATQKIQGIAPHTDTAWLCVERQRGNHTPLSLFHTSFLVRELTCPAARLVSCGRETWDWALFVTLHGVLVVRAARLGSVGRGLPELRRHGSNWNHAPPRALSSPECPAHPTPSFVCSRFLSLCHDFSNWIQICSFYDKNHKNMISNLLRCVCLCATYKGAVGLIEPRRV